MQITSASGIARLGTIMGVWAHPDDESFCCAGIMLSAIANGQKVICVTATKGEAGIQDESRWPASKLGEIRAKELEDALKILGVKNQNYLGYIDGDCDKISDTEAVARIKELIAKYRPDTILTFGPEGLTGHPDHQKVSVWASQAAAGLDIKIYHYVESQEAYDNYLKDFNQKFNIYYNIDKPPIKEVKDCDINFHLNPELLRTKLAALMAQPSQTEAMFKKIPEIMSKAFVTECFVKAS